MASNSGEKSQRGALPIGCPRCEARAFDGARCAACGWLSPADKFAGCIDHATPAGCGDELERIDRAVSKLREATHRLSIAWRREQKRSYGYLWDSIEPASGPEELVRAQEEWLQARADLTAEVKP